MTRNQHQGSPEYLMGFRAAFEGATQGECPHERGSLAWKQWVSGWFGYHPSYGHHMVVRRTGRGWTVTRLETGQVYGSWPTAEAAAYAFRENAALGLVTIEGGE